MGLAGPILERRVPLLSCPQLSSVLRFSEHQSIPQRDQYGTTLEGSANDDGEKLDQYRRFFQRKARRRKAELGPFLILQLFCLKSLRRSPLIIEFRSKRGRTWSDSTPSSLTSRNSLRLRAFALKFSSLFMHCTNKPIQKIVPHNRRQ